MLSTQINLQRRFGKDGGAFFKQEGGFNWFHIPIAAPFALDGQNLVLTTIFVFTGRPTGQ
jgi:hypothetical protein